MSIICWICLASFLGIGTTLVVFQQEENVPILIDKLNN